MIFRPEIQTHNTKGENNTQALNLNVTWNNACHNFNHGAKVDGILESRVLQIEVSFEFFISLQ